MRIGEQHHLLREVDSRAPSAFRLTRSRRPVASARVIDGWREFGWQLLDAFVRPRDGHHLAVRGHERIIELISGQEEQWEV